jgi:hypothetical protein
LFEHKDGVYKSLEKMKDGAAKISYYNQKEYEGKDYLDRDDSRAMHEMKLNGFTEIEFAIHELEVQLMTYLNFADVDGWNNKNLTMAGSHAKTGYEWLRAKLMGLLGKQGS